MKTKTIKTTRTIKITKLAVINGVVAC